MDASSPMGSVDPTALSRSGHGTTYPTPPPMHCDSPTTQPEQPSKKKRKAWGQPVPEIKPILPPRKRAKTVEEKEQRKNERILRNRRAADKSRQRQKAAVAELELEQGRIREENAVLREMLLRYETRFGIQQDLRLTLPAPPISENTSAPSPLDLNTGEPTPSSSYSYDTPAPHSSQPTFAVDDSATLMKTESPALAPTLNLTDEDIKTEESLQMSAFDTSMDSVSDMTQYPAVILCDLQCQSETGVIKLSAVPSTQAFNLGISQLLQAIQALTIFQTFSTTTLLPMYSLFQILAQRLATSSMEQTFSSILTNFPLIHSLISMPSTPTRPAVFRMKLLSRLLACSPHMARLLLAATDRALQQVVHDETFAEDADRRWSFSSLMTIKWVILRLEREHRKIRRQVETPDNGVSEDQVMDGVDYGAVARNSQLWYGAAQNCMNMEESWTHSHEVRTEA